MSKLYNEPKTIKNGHLTQKLQSINGGAFSENPLSHPHLLSNPALFVWSPAPGWETSLSYTPDIYTPAFAIVLFIIRSFTKLT